MYQPMTMPVFKELFSPTKCAHILMFAGSRWWFGFESFPGAAGNLLLQMLVHTLNLMGSRMA